MKQHLAPWGVRCYRKAGEAVIWRKVPTGMSTGKRGEAKDPARAASEAARRRQTKVRRLSVENRLCRLWTLTYRVEASGRDTVVHDIDTFTKRLRRQYPRLRYLWVIEKGEKNGRLHIHIAFNAFVPKAAIERIWGLGFVDARRIRGRDDGSGDSAACARYLAKYVGKSAGGSDPVLWNRRRYGRSANCELSHDDYEVEGPIEAEYLTIVVMNRGAPTHVWRSCETEDWRGPPVSVAYWST